MRTIDKRRRHNHLKSPHWLRLYMLGGKYGAFVPLVKVDGPQPNECHANVLRWCELHLDNHPVRGWLYFDYGGADVVMFLSHSVVRCPDGSLIDITPQNRRQPDYPFIESEQSEDDYAALVEGNGVTRVWHIVSPLTA